MRKGKTTQFLNIDLDIVARSGLAGLVRTLEPRMFALRKTRTQATLELSEQPGTLAEAIGRIVEAVKQLSPAPRRTWNNCRTRNLNIGIASACNPHEAAFVLPASVLKRAVSVNADVVITVYGSSGYGAAQK